MKLLLVGFFFRAQEGFQLFIQRLYVRVLLALAHGHAVTDEELEEIMHQIGHLTGEVLELFPGDAAFLI